MKKACSIILAIIILLSALCIWQRNNLKAVYLFLTNDTEDVERILEENRATLEEKVKEYGDYVTRGLTAEEEAQIASGELSVEEATKMLLEEAEKAAEEKINEEAEKEAETVEDVVPVTPDAKEPVKETEKEEKTSSQKAESDKKKEGEIIRNYTAQFYSLKAYYMGQLSQIETRAKNDYSALSKEEKKNLSKASFISKYVGYATSLQNECDGKVNSLLKSMKEELKAIGADTAIIGVIQQTYEQEKAARKAYYMNMVS